MNVFINYDEKTLNIKGAYGEKENTPKPFIPIEISEWSDKQKYGIDNLTVDIKNVTLIVSSDTISSYENNLAVYSAIAKITEIENSNSYKRSLRVSSLTLTSTGAIDTTSTDFKVITNYNSQIQIYAVVISTKTALTTAQKKSLSNLESELSKLLG
jgi:DNA primase catalytic subunit